MGITLENVNAETIQVMTGVWAKVKDLDNYEEDAGSVLFQNLFQKCPEAQVLFGFPLDIYPDPTELVGSRRFIMHACFLMEMIDSTIALLGKDNEKLSESLVSLGKKHSTYGVKPEMFPHMIDSMVAMLRTKLGKNFTSTEEDCWLEVFGVLVEDIIEAQNALSIEEAAKNKATVESTWAQFTKIANYEEVGGVILFSHLFEVCPDAKPLFGFPLDMDPRAREILRGKRFLRHAAFLIQMIDKTVSLLGVDNETLAKEMTKLGEKHVTFGVSPQYFNHMTDSIVHMLTDQIGSDFSYADKVAWEKVLGALIGDMVKGQRRLVKGLAAKNKSTVIKSWRNLMQMPNYEERAGVLLFKHLFTDLPQSKVLFGFPIDMELDAMSNSKRFLMHAGFLVGMIEKALNMLGTDDDELTIMMSDLGRKHIVYGVKSEYMPSMKEAIKSMLHQMLEMKFTDKDEDAWDEVLSVLISDMTRAQREVNMKREIDKVKAARK